MRILEVIHGFPPYYMAGSEVYAYTLSKELAKSHDVYVFSRIENPFMDIYSLVEENIEGIKLFRVNKPRGDYTLSDKYLDNKIDEIYQSILKDIDPDVVHIHHLSHLSTNIPILTKKYFGKPVVFTIHDFWMFCPRGQLLTSNYKLCEGPDVTRCSQCLNYLHVKENDIIKYLTHMREVLDNIDVFLSPSNFLRDYFIKEGLPDSKIIYSPYGFDKSKIKYRRKKYSSDDSLSFGYIGRIIPSKGIHLLIKAFSSIEIKKGSSLHIYGDAGRYKTYLEKLGDQHVHFHGGFHNDEIDKILDNIDVLVVPSIWYENSPLVIQEAFLKGIPVIASNIGGMKELISDGVDGFLFRMGDIKSLSDILTNLIDNPTLLNSLQVKREKVRSIEDDADAILKVFRRVSNEASA